MDRPNEAQARNLATLDVAVAHLKCAANSLQRAMDNGVADALDDGHVWRLVLNTVSSARQFVTDSRDALAAAEPHVFDGRGLGLEGDR